MNTTVSIVRTASTLPAAVVTNREIGERLIAGVPIDDEAGEEIVAKVRERSELIEKKTGLRARRFFDPSESPVAVGLELLERLMAGEAWSGLDALIVSSSSTHGFPGLSQQIVAAARTRECRMPCIALIMEAPISFDLPAAATAASSNVRSSRRPHPGAAPSVSFRNRRSQSADHQHERDDGARDRGGERCRWIRGGDVGEPRDRRHVLHQGL